MTASSTTATSTGLSWGAATGAASYQEVLMSTNNGDTYTDWASTTVTGLTASTGYYRFRATAVDSGGVRGPLSTSIGVTTTA